MSTNKILVAAVIGAIVEFFAGWVIYGMLLKNAMEPSSEAVRSLMIDPPNLGLIFVSCLLWALLLAWILGKWAGVSSVSGGAQAGAIIGLLASASWDTGMAAMMNMSTTAQMCMDVCASTVMSAITGAVIGWWFGRGNA